MELLNSFWALSCNMSIWLTKVTDQEVIDIVSSMKSSAAGPDYISLRIVKSILPFFVQNFVDLVNVCFKEGSFPSAFKRANIVPWYLNRVTQRNFNNYRLISLLSTFSRVMEKSIFVRVDSFFW